MRFLLTEDCWVLDALNAAEWHFICELPDIASGEGLADGIEERLYPSPLAEDELVDENSFDQLEDWNDYVKPDLEQGFKNSREVVKDDLALVTKIEIEEPAEDEEDVAPIYFDGDLRRLVVSKDHTDHWYSTLNQARLLLNEDHDLAEDQERLMMMMGMESDLPPEKALVMAQYEMYSAIQSILVENVMN